MLWGRYWVLIVFNLSFNPTLLVAINPTDYSGFLLSKIVLLKKLDFWDLSMQTETESFYWYVCTVPNVLIDL